MKISGTVVDKTRNLNIEDIKNALVLELKRRHADARINHKGEVEWCAGELTSLLKLLFYFFDKKANRIFGTKGIIRFNMNIHAAYDILYEISFLARLAFELLLSICGLIWFYYAAPAEVPEFMMRSVVGFIFLGFAIDYLTLKYTFAGLIKNEIKKARKAYENIEKSGA